MKYRIFFFLSLLLMPLSAGGLFLAFLSLPTTSLLFCITELFSATASLSAILFFGIGFFQMVKEQNTKSELALLKQQQEVSSIQEQQLSNLQKDTIHNKKSFYHHLETIQKAIRSEQYTEALSSLESLLLRPSRSNPASYCADSYINAVLQFKQEEAHRYGISVNYQILLPDLQLLKNFSASELSCILFNLLDNGIEACIQSEKATPEIHLQIHTEGTMLCIHIENTKTPARTFQKTTTKSAAIRHGFGLGIIETIVEKYGGICHFTDQGDSFDSSIILNYQENRRYPISNDTYCNLRRH